MKPSKDMPVSTPDSGRIAALDLWEGVAVSCFLGIFGALAVTRRGVTPDSGIILWTIFVLLCGIALSLPQPLTIRRMILISLPAAASFLLTLLFKGGIQVMFGAAKIVVASIGEVSLSETFRNRQIVRFAVFYLLLFLVTVPAIILAVLARNRVIVGIKLLWKAGPQGVSRAEKIINSVARIVALVIGVKLLV
jgi:hypothetical protein